MTAALYSPVSNRGIPPEVTFIYALGDPETLEIRYVGKANNPAKRLVSHMKGHGTNSVKKHWLASLREKGLTPNIVILAECGMQDWERAEIFWIKEMRLRGARLLNLSDGGDGSEFCTDQTRRAISQALQISEKKKALNERQRGVPFSQQRKDAIRRAVAASPLQKAKKGKSLPESWRAAISEGRLKSPQAMAQLHALHVARKGVPRTEDEKAKIAASLKTSERAKAAQKLDSERKMGTPQSPEQKLGLKKYHQRKRQFKLAGFQEKEARKLAAQGWKK